MNETVVSAIVGVASALITLGGAHRMFIMPSIREEVRKLLDAEDFVKKDQLEDLKGWMKRLDEKIDRLIERKARQ